MRSRKILAATLFGILIQSSATGAETIDSLFYVTKKQNKNQVHYAANVNNCKWIKENPLHVYWRMLQKGPNVREELDGEQEHKYFGYGVVSIDDSSLSIQLGAFKATPKLSNLVIRIALSGDGSICKSEQRIKIDDDDILLTYMHAEYTIFGLKAVEFHGKNTKGIAITKRLTV
jgi:hypothetical protein